MVLFWFSKYKSIVKYWKYLFLFRLCTWTSFPGAALPKYHKLVCLKIEFFFTVEIYCLTILEAKKSNIKVSAGPWSFQIRRQVLPWFFLASGGLLLPLGVPWLGAAAPLAQSLPLSSLALSLAGSLLLWKDTGHTRLGSHPTSLWPHLNVTNYICKNLILNKVTFWGTGG